MWQTAIGMSSRVAPLGRGRLDLHRRSFPDQRVGSLPCFGIHGRDAHATWDPLVIPADCGFAGFFGASTAPGSRKRPITPKLRAQPQLRNHPTPGMDQGRAATQVAGTDKIMPNPQGIVKRYVRGERESVRLFVVTP